MSFGERLSAVRKERGLKQVELSRLVGIGPVILSRYENGVITPSIEVASRLAGALKVSLDYLVNGINAHFESGNIDEQLMVFNQLSEEDKKHVLAVLEAFSLKNGGGKL